jgi:hypothetical protein
MGLHKIRCDTRVYASGCLGQEYQGTYRGISFQLMLFVGGSINRANEWRHFRRSSVGAEAMTASDKTAWGV